MIKMRRVITLAGGICLPAPDSGAPNIFGCSSAVELDPSLDSPMGPSFSLSSSPSTPLFPTKVKSSPPKSSASGIASRHWTRQRNSGRFLKNKIEMIYYFNWIVTFAFPILGVRRVISNQHPDLLSALIGPSRLLRRAEIGSAKHMESATFRHRRCARTPYEHVELFGVVVRFALWLRLLLLILSLLRLVVVEMVLCVLSNCGRNFWIGCWVRIGWVESKPGRADSLSSRSTVLLEIRGSGRRTPRRLHRVQVRRWPSRKPWDPHHRIKVWIVEIGTPWRRVSGWTQAVDLCAGEIGGARRQCRKRTWPERASRRVGLPYRHVKLAVIADFGVCLKKVPTVEGNDVWVHLEGNNGCGSLGELLHDQHLGATVLEEKEEKGVPNDALQHHNLHHQTTGVWPIHGDQEWNTHDQCVWKRRKWEYGNHPLQASILGEVSPYAKHDEHDDLLKRVGSDKPEVHCVGIVLRDEMEREQRNSKNGHEAVDAGALVGREDFPPANGAIS